jgi:hypothetical protein
LGRCTNLVLDSAARVCTNVTELKIMVRCVRIENNDARRWDAALEAVDESGRGVCRDYTDGGPLEYDTRTDALKTLENMVKNAREKKKKKRRRRRRKRLDYERAWCEVLAAE